MKIHEIVIFIILAIWFIIFIVFMLQDIIFHSKLNDQDQEDLDKFRKLLNSPRNAKVIADNYYESDDITLPHTERNVNIMLKDVIKEEREKQDLSLSELARRCGHAVSTLHAIESGDNSNPSYRTIADICAALGLSLDELERRTQKNESDKLSQ